jgi:hypothetical protein
MKDPADIFEAALQILRVLPKLIGNRAPEIEAELRKLLEQDKNNQATANKIFSVLSRYDETAQWLVKFLLGKQILSPKPKPTIDPGTFTTISREISSDFLDSIGHEQIIQINAVKEFTPFEGKFEVTSNQKRKIPKKTIVTVTGKESGSSKSRPAKRRKRKLKPATNSLNKPTDQPKRYSDFTFYRESSAGQKADRLEDGKPLKNNCWYQLEAAIREKTTGIKTSSKRKPIREPQQQNAVELLVTAYSDDFEIKNPVQFLVLPPKGDSMNPLLFRVRPHQPTADRPARIHLRMYYEFNLLEAVNIDAEVISEFDLEQSKSTAPVSFEQTRRTEGELLDFENVIPRQMHIDITKDEGNYVFTFALRKKVNSNKDDDKIVLTAPVQIRQAEIESDLVELRKALLNLTTSKTYINQLEAKDEIEFARSTNRLARSGRNLWAKLFRREKNSAMWNIGVWLQKHPLALNSKIQISTEDAASDFVFPWNLIYDSAIPDDKDETPDLNGFWGLRYEIEQRLPNKLASDAPINSTNNFEIGFMLWNFEQENEQRLLITNLIERAKGRLAHNEAIIRARDAYQYLEDCNSQILYFFTHGHTKLLESSFGGGLNLKHFEAFYEALPPDSPLRENLKHSYQEIKDKKFEADRSWIGLKTGKIYLDELYDRDVNLKQVPIVILNMCESAQVTPSLAQNSFTHFFWIAGRAESSEPNA